MSEVRLIDAIELVRYMCGACPSHQNGVCIDKACWKYEDRARIENAPAIEAEPVRYGEWHECWYTDTVCASICTNCGKAATQSRTIVGQELMTNVRYPLCPHCGARMNVRLKEG